MIDFTDAKISEFVTHFVGNKLRTEGTKLSESLNESSEATTKYLLNYFLSPFKSLDFYSFNHTIELEYNEIFSLCCKVFDTPKSLVKNSKHFAKHLYEHSLHPKIKSGELTIVFFENCVNDDEIIDAIGVFKTETKDVFLKINDKEQHFVFKHEQGININKLEKGCLVLNTDRDKGFKVMMIDRVANDEAQYWKNEYLNLKSFQNDYSQTKALVELTKAFVSKEMDKQVETNKIDKIDILAKSRDYFLNSKKFHEKEYVETVFDSAPEVQKAFKEYKKNYQENNNVDIKSNFDVSEIAVKKSSKALKSVIKLDKNIQIFVNGSSEQIEVGFDKSRGKKFYKIYFTEES